LNKTTMTGDRFIEAFLGGLSVEGLKHRDKDRRAEFRRGSQGEQSGNPDATRCGQQGRNGPHNLEHAKLMQRFAAERPDLEPALLADGIALE
jgi:hypothetical protein